MMPRHFFLFMKCVITLTLITLGERLIFFAYFSSLHATYSLSDLSYITFWGLRFDLAVAGSFSLLIYFIASVTALSLKIRFITVVRWTMYVAVVTTVVLQGADIMYFSETGRHLGYEIRDTFVDIFSLLGTALNAYPKTLLLHIINASAAVWLVHRLFREKTKSMFAREDDAQAWFIPVIETGLAIVLAIIMVRGGVYSVPQSPLNAQAIGDTQRATLALNGTYNAIYFAISNSRADPVKLAVTDSRLDQQKIIRQLYPTAAQDSTAKVSQSLNKTSTKPVNVVTILLESWPAAFMKSYGFKRDVTPYFDALRKQSLTTYNMLAGGHRTTEGMFAVFCSAQNPLGKTVAQTQLQTFPYHCLPRMLRDQGYYTAFFQGTNKNTSGTGVFAQLLGFTDSYGRKDVVKRRYEENSWGVHDPDLYNLVLDKMRSAHQPFFIGINTATTHDITLPKGVKPFIDPSRAEDPMLNVMHFADTALRDFITKAQQVATLNPTVFVLVADHTAAVLASNYEAYSIPFLIYAPGVVSPQYVDRVAAQRDIAPTVLQILDKPIPEQFAGKSLLRDDQGPYFAEYFHAGLLGWIEGNDLVEIPVLNPDHYRCYNYRADPVQTHSVTCNQNAAELEHHAMAFTAISQQLLFSGHLNDFGLLKMQSKPKLSASTILNRPVN